MLLSKAAALTLACVTGAAIAADAPPAPPRLTVSIRDAVWPENVRASTPAAEAVKAEVNERIEQMRGFLQGVERVPRNADYAIDPVELHPYPSEYMLSMSILPRYKSVAAPSPYTLNAQIAAEPARMLVTRLFNETLFDPDRGPYAQLRVLSLKAAISSSQESVVIAEVEDPGLSAGGTPRRLPVLEQQAAKYQLLIDRSESSKPCKTDILLKYSRTLDQRTVSSKQILTAEFEYNDATRDVPVLSDLLLIPARIYRLQPRYFDPPQALSNEAISQLTGQPGRAACQ